MQFDYAAAHRRHMRAQGTATALALFSLGLGLTQLFAARAVTKALGLRGGETLVRACGLREVASGLGILNGNEAPTWLAARAAGDLADLAALAAMAPMSSKRGSVALAAGAVAGIAALDYVTAKALGSQADKPRGEIRDYSDRSGFSRPPDQMRGAWRDSAGYGVGRASSQEAVRRPTS
jgi:hypothetical protein